jgi:hypothetical protein
MNKELLWTISTFLVLSLLPLLIYLIMSLLPKICLFIILVALTCIYFREILWGAGVHIAAAVRTMCKFLYGLPPQSVETGTSDSGSKVEGREAANFRSQKSIVLGSPVEAIHNEGALSEHKGGDTPPPPNFRSPSENKDVMVVRGPDPDA